MLFFSANCLSVSKKFLPLHPQSRNKQMKVFFASGLYDLCTTAGNARYLATHSNLDQNRVTIGEYPSGHMAYLGKESFDLLAKDMRAFFECCI